MTRISGLFSTLYSAAAIALLLTALGAGSAWSPVVLAEPIGLMQRYALAEDREAVLAELIPGSVDAYFYHCLHYQVTGRLELAEAKLREWESDDSAKASPLLLRIRDRQRLLTYGISPDRTTEYLKSRLNLQLNHASRPVRGQRQYADALPLDILDQDKLIDEALRGDRQLTQAGLRRLSTRILDHKAGVPAVDLAWLLNQVDGPWMPRLDELVAAELVARRPQERRFGDLAGHRWLTTDQLDKVSASVPTISTDDAFVREKLLRMRANDDCDINQQPAVKYAYLQRVNQYVQTLPPAWNSLRAATLYRLLEADLAAGRPDRQRFLEYLKLPRSSPIVFPRRQQLGQPVANLAEDFTELALIPPIGGEQQLVRAYLEIFLQDADSPEEFASLIRADYLNDVFAETKLLTGAGNPDQWYRLLSPAQQQQLKDRVELSLVPTNPRYHDAQKLDAQELLDTELLVDVKNVSELVVRVFEINTQSYYRTHDQPLNTDIDLDGLVAVDEQRIEFKQPAIRRHRERIVLPAIQGRGVWVVDLLGGGQRTRALIRRGELQVISSQTPHGQRFTLLDEHRNIVSGGRMLVRSQEFVADEHGQITIPMADRASSTQAIVSDDRLAQRITFEIPVENYSLAAGILLPAQQLLPSRTAELVIRPGLQLNGHPTPLSLLQNTALVLTLTDMQGVQTTKRYTGLTFDERDETVVEFRVIPQLQQVAATLSGQIQSTATNRFIDLQVNRSWNVNGANRTAATMDAYLTRDDEDWVLEVRGKNGEPIDAAVVSISLQPGVRAGRIEQTLQSDANGRITLGPLPGMTRIHYAVTGGPANQRTLLLDRAPWPSRLHGIVGQPQRLAIDDDALHDLQPVKNPAQNPTLHLGRRFRLLELRADRPSIDLTEKLSVIQGQLVFQPARAGNFRLIDLRSGRDVSLAITLGKRVGDTAVGEVRQLEVPRRDPVGIASIVRDQSGLQIRLSGDAPAARVHVLATRYLPQHDALSALALPSPTPPQAQWMTLAENGFVSGMRLGEEYQYVLRRQRAPQYAGVMLPQPSLLLNPWETEVTSTGSTTAAAGDQPRGAPMASQPARSEQGQASRNQIEHEVPTATYDFLQSSGRLVLNLTADQDGLVHVPAEVIAKWPVLQVVVTDPASQVQRTLFGSLPELETRDLRLPTALPSDQAFTFQRGVTIASPDHPLDLASLGSAQLQVYSSAGDLFELYLTLSSDSRLEQFRDLAKWHTLDQNRKREAYGRLAAHETHVFLWMHDKPFFEEIVRPYLANKKDKQLVDAWLLDMDLSSWTQPWRYATLNSFERAVLARELTEQKHQAFKHSILRELRERVALIKDSPDVFRRAVESGLLSKQLSTGQLRKPESQSADEEQSFRSSMDLGRDDSRSQSLDLMAQTAKKKEGLQILDRDKATRRSRLDERGYFETQPPDRKSSQRFFEHLDSTKQWAESNWDHVRVAKADEQTIPLNAFWLDWATNENQPVSKNLLLPTDNRHAALIAMAVCGLPLQAGKVALPAEHDGIYRPEHAVAVVTKRLTELKSTNKEAGLLIAQRFETLGASDARESEPEIRVAPAEFLTQTAYLGQVVVTNPTPRPLEVDVLWQIPAGAMALAGSLATDNATIRLQPFAVETREYRFYFPAPGDFIHYPACVSHDGNTLTRGERRSFHVVETATQTNRESWEAVARDGSAEQIKTFLAKRNLHELNLGQILPRMKDRAIYDVMIGALHAARIDAPELQAYAILHKDPVGIQDFLQMRRDLIESVGPVLHCELLDVEPIEQAIYEHLEYAPLVNARVHALRAEPEILNDRFLIQYRSFMGVLAYQNQPTPEQQLALCYYLTIQNRIDEALDRFGHVEPGQNGLRLQYDYLSAYFSLHRGDLKSASELADRYVDYPVPRWRERFDQLATELNQHRQLVAGTPATSDAKNSDLEAAHAQSADLAIMDRDRRQASAAQSQPSVQIVLDGDQLRITHRNTQRVTLNYFGVDLELLFSKTPFVRDDLARMTLVRPTAHETIELRGDGVSMHRIDPALTNQTLLVEATSGGARSTALIYGGHLSTYIAESFGQLQVSEAGNRQPVSRAYVKVYAKSETGEVKFYKDGYTDLRGRFDYATLSAPELANVARFAILVLDQERGATLHEVAPPTQ